MMSRDRLKSAKAFGMVRDSIFGRSIRELSRFATRFREAQSGAGALEFACVVPVLLMLYVGAFETTLGMSASKRTSRAAGAIADLVTQRDSTTPAQLATMTHVAESIFAPYTPNNMKLKISGIRIDGKGVPRIEWSWQKGGSPPYAKNSTASVKQELKTPGSFLVHAELQVDQDIGQIFSNFFPGTSGTITISRDFYFRQRIGNGVDCPAC